MGHVYSHPGQLLRHIYMHDNRLSATALAREIGVPRNQILDIVHGRAGITSDMAARLGKFFGNGRQHWLNMQSGYESTAKQP